MLLCFPITKILRFRLVFDGSPRDKHYPTSKLKTSAMNRLSDASDTTLFYLGIFWLMALIGLITLLLCFCLILIANPLSWWKKRKQMGAVIADLNATYGPREVEWEIIGKTFIYICAKKMLLPLLQRRVLQRVHFQVQTMSFLQWTVRFLETITWMF